MSGCHAARQLMPPSRFIWGSLGGFILIYGLLIFPWPGWNDVYSRAFRTAGNAIFSNTQGDRFNSFEVHRDARGPASMDTRIVLGNRTRANENGMAPALELEL